MLLRLLFVSIYAMLGCTTTSPTNAPEPQGSLIPKAGDSNEAPVIDIKSEKNQFETNTNSQSDRVVDLTQTDAAPAQLEQNDNCVASELLTQVPGFSEDLQVVVTRVNQPCRTLDGKQGYQPDSSWMAMGFPCTAGKGKLTIRGKSYRPKMIVYHLENDCPMSPRNSLELKERVGGLEGTFLKPEKLIALTPFSLLYWESVEYPDAGVGPSVGMLSTSYLKEGWKKFQKQEVLNFKLYGQENAWVTDKRFYEIEAELKQDERRTFQITLKTVRALNNEELAKIKKRCEMLKPARPCNSLQNPANKG